MDADELEAGARAIASFAGPAGLRASGLLTDSVLSLGKGMKEIRRPFKQVSHIHRSHMKPSPESRK